MEPATDVCPKNIFDKKDCCMNYPCNRELRKNLYRFNQYVNEKILFVLDEMIRVQMDLGGAKR